MLCLLPLLLLGGGVGSCWASFGVSAQLFPGAPAVFRFVSCGWGSTPGWLRLAALFLRWWFSVGLGVSLYRCPVTPLGFYLVPVQLPLRGSAPLPGASACLAPACWSAPGVGLGGSLLRHLVFSHVPCSSSGPAACAVFPAAGSLRVFAPCVRVLQLHWCLLGLTVRSPCCPSLTLGWVCFWPTMSPAQGITLRPCLLQLHPGTGRMSH